MRTNGDMQSELDPDRIGRIGERQFETLCERAGLYCNKSVVDVMGWDFIVELPDRTWRNCLSSLRFWLGGCSFSLTLAFAPPLNSSSMCSGRQMKHIWPLTSCSIRNRWRASNFNVTRWRYHLRHPKACISTARRSPTPASPSAQKSSSNSPMIRSGRIGRSASKLSMFDRR